MNKKTLTLIIILILIALGLFYVKIKGGGQMTAGPADQSQSLTETYSESAKLAMAIQSGESLMCKLTKGEDYMDYYVMNGKFRMDGMTQGKMSHMVNDQEYIYTWSDDGGYALKMAVPGEGEPVPSDPNLESTPSLKSEDDYRQLENEGYTINCQAGTSDPSLFALPSDVNFTDPASMMQQALPSGLGMSPEQVQQLQEQYQGMGQ